MAKGKQKTWSGRLTEARGPARDGIGPSLLAALAAAPDKPLRLVPPGAAKAYRDAVYRVAKRLERRGDLRMYLDWGEDADGRVNLVSFVAHPSCTLVGKRTSKQRDVTSRHLLRPFKLVRLRRMLAESYVPFLADFGNDELSELYSLAAAEPDDIKLEARLLEWLVAMGGPADELRVGVRAVVLSLRQTAKVLRRVRAEERAERRREREAGRG